MRICKLQIKNYRCIHDTSELKPTKLFALIGKNNSGKSTLVKALQVFWGQEELKIEDFHKNTPDNIKISISLTEPYDSKFEKYINKEGNIDIHLECSPQDLKPTYYVNGEKIAQKDIKNVLPELLIIPAIRNPQNESSAGTKSYMKDLISFMLKEQPGEIRPAEMPKKEIEQKKLCEASEDEIETFLTQKRKDQIKHLSDNVSGRFQQIISDDQLKIEITPEGDLSKVIASYSTKVINSELIKNIPEGINLLSCGTGLQSMFILSLLQTYADMRKCSDAILLIEEPEVYLHPEYQRKMFYALRGIAGGNQVIYTTHSPIMISELWADDSVRLVTLKNGQTIIETIDIATVISELGIKYEDVLNPRVIVFVEGDDDVEFFEHFTECLRPRDKESLSRQIKFIPSDSYRTIHSYAYMRIIHSQNVDVEFYIIADSDGHDAETRRKYLKEQINKKIGKIREDSDLLNRIKILNEYAIESYLLDTEILSKTFTDIKKTSIEYMIHLYKEKYAAIQQEVKSNPKKRQDLGKYFRPKHFFENKVKQHPEGYKRFCEIYDNNTAFLETRDLLASKCEQLKQSGKSVIRTILSNADISKDNFKELSTIIENILSNANEENRNRKTKLSTAKVRV